MSLAHTSAIALQGMGGSLVDIEADLSAGLPGLSLIGLPDRALGEACERVRAAIGNAGFSLPARRLTVNLSPAALPKHGSGFDLAIALACLGAAGDVNALSLRGTVHIGELALDGRVRPTPGVVAAVLAARERGASRVIVPRGNHAQATLVPGIEIVAVASLREAAIYHGAKVVPVEVEPLETAVMPSEAAGSLDLADVIANDEAKAALTVAAAGGHHLFLLGPPGSGKTMLATRLPTILPPLSPDEFVETCALASLAGSAVARDPGVRPFEAPHHTASAAAIVGGGQGLIRPGAAARASHGVLFLDEAPEFSSDVLECLRQPLESGAITIHRAHAVATFPAKFQLVLAANPCPCGLFGTTDGICECAPAMRRRYLGKLSGPLMDRVDLQVRVDRVSATRLRLSDEPPESSALVRTRVIAAREAARERWRETPWKTNSQVSGAHLRSAGIRPPASTSRSLDRALERGQITMRGYDRILRVAWSLSDLDGATSPSGDHLGRALFLRKGITA
jgi:magnesium chelatase family protein